MKIWDATTAEIMMEEIISGTPAKDAICNALIREMRIPYDSTVSVVEIFNILKGMDAPEDHDWTVSDGVLVMDGVSVARVGAKTFFPVLDDRRADYYEDRVLGDID